MSKLKERTDTCRYAENYFRKEYGFDAVTGCPSPLWGDEPFCYIAHKGDKKTLIYSPGYGEFHIVDGWYDKVKVFSRSGRIPCAVQIEKKWNFIDSFTDKPMFLEWVDGVRDGNIMRMGQKWSMIGLVNEKCEGVWHDDIRSVDYYDKTKDKHSLSDYKYYKFRDGDKWGVIEQYFSYGYSQFRVIEAIAAKYGDIQSVYKVNPYENPFEFMYLIVTWNADCELCLTAQTLSGDEVRLEDTFREFDFDERIISRWGERALLDESWRRCTRWMPKKGLYVLDDNKVAIKDYGQWMVLERDLLHQIDYRHNDVYLRGIVERLWNKYVLRSSKNGYLFFPQPGTHPICTFDAIGRYNYDTWGDGKDVLEVCRNGMWNVFDVKNERLMLDHWVEKIIEAKNVNTKIVVLTKEGDFYCLYGDSGNFRYKGKTYEWSDNNGGEVYLDGRYIPNEEEENSGNAIDAK